MSVNNIYNFVHFVTSNGFRNPINTPIPTAVEIQYYSIAMYSINCLFHVITEKHKTDTRTIETRYKCPAGVDAGSDRRGSSCEYCGRWYVSSL